MIILIRSWIQGNGSRHHMDKTQKKQSMLARFAAYYKPYLGLFAADLFFAAVQGGVGLAFPSIISYLINDIFTLTDRSLILPILTRTAILMFVLYIVEAIALYFVTSYGHIMGARIEADMRHDLFGHME